MCSTSCSLAVERLEGIGRTGASSSSVQGQGKTPQARRTSEATSLHLAQAPCHSRSISLHWAQLNSLLSPTASTRTQTDNVNQWPSDTFGGKCSQS